MAVYDRIMNIIRVAFAYKNLPVQVKDGLISGRPSAETPPEEEEWEFQ